MSDIQVGQLFVVSGVDMDFSDPFSAERAMVADAFHSANGKVLRLLCQQGPIAVCDVVYDGERRESSVAWVLSGGGSRAREGRLMLNLSGLQMLPVSEAFAKMLMPEPETKQDAPHSAMEDLLAMKAKYFGNQSKDTP